MIERKITKEIHVGPILIGGSNPISIQSMTNTDTRDSIKTIEQIKKLEEAGCEIIRIAVPDMEAAQRIKEIKKSISIPLVADIHFDYRLALAAIDGGVDKLRINPGNIGSKDKIKQVVEKAQDKNIPIRIGVNSGSLEKDLVEKYNGVTPNGLVESALRHVEILEDLNFFNTIISIKASSVPFSLEAYRIISQQTDYPLHLGITKAGTVYTGAIKSAVGIGAILAMGIGDTIRVSLTGDPLEEVKCAKEILKSLGLRNFGIEFISCPTCGRTEIDLIQLACKAEEYCAKVNKNIRVAFMGCVVNGPGEAKESDIGIAAGKGFGFIFKKGEILRKVSEEKLLEELLIEIEKI